MNQSLSSLHVGSLEITLTVPLRVLCEKTGERTGNRPRRKFIFSFIFTLHI